MQDKKVEVNFQLVRTTRILVSSKKSLKKKMPLNSLQCFSMPEYSCWLFKTIVQDLYYYK